MQERSVIVMVPVVRYINRDQDEQRRAHVESSAAAAGYTTARIAAINGHAPDFAEAYADRIGGQITPGTQACFLSHALAWAQIADGPDPVGLVAEDDATFLRPASELAPYLQALTGAVMLFLNDRAIAYRTYGKIDPSLATAPLEATWEAAMDEPRDPSFPRYGRMIRDIKAPGGDFYALTREGATRLLEEAAKDRATTDVDCWMFYKCLTPEAIHRHRRRFIPRVMRQGGVGAATVALQGAIVDQAFATTDARKAGGRVRNPNRPAA